MAIKQEENVTCQICGKEKPLSEVMPAACVRDSVVDIIRKTYRGWSPEGFICFSDFDRFGGEYTCSVLTKGKGETSVLDEQVIKSLRDQELLSMNINEEFDRKLTFGERWADRVTNRVGSWRFILIFVGVVLVWMAINSILLLQQEPFDPYPFIFLNLVLSCIAAIQAPVIMMSQNRQDARDRLRSEHDYQVNLKAELEIRHLQEKIDYLFTTQWQRLGEMQRVQNELIEELRRRTRGESGA